MVLAPIFTIKQVPILVFQVSEASMISVAKFLVCKGPQKGSPFHCIPVLRLEEFL